MANSSLGRYIINALAAAATWLACGCADEVDLEGAYCPEGEASTVTLRVNVAAPTEMSRAADTDVNTLWVGVYNAASGLCTYNHLFDREQTSPSEAAVQFQTLSGIECESGRSYIVAVANPVGNNGMDLSGDKTKQPLETLLAAADTWDKYMAIATADARMADDMHISVNAPTDALLMEGAYSETHKNGEAAIEIEPVNIRPGDNTLTGAIHLRRLITQNTLNISATDNIIEMEVSEIEVFNVPAYSWLHCRNQGDDLTAATAYANVGDAFDPAGPATGNACYPTSLKFNPPDAVKLVDGVYQFSFWQYENKRTGLDNCTAYANRESEFKTADGKNSGVYSSLSPTATGDLNNNATYVKITANVRYRNPGQMVNPDGLDLPDKGESRTATVTYVVHLGYVDDDPKDFNCYRNSKYTYNIMARSVSDVLLEAFRQGEPAPGAEGVVTDVTNEFIELDAHSSAFNIYLTAQEIGTFSFTMRTYDHGASHVVRVDDKGVQHNLPQPGDADFKYYNWIELVPTGNTNPNANAEDLAPYPKTTELKYGRKNVLFPHELPASGLTGQWFTVYVNEYTYEKRIGEAGYGDETGAAWKGYVNQPARQAWFNVRQQISDDGESVYFGSKYALRQQSIQTYYDYNAESCTSALGIEHRNESFGMNVRWTCDWGTCNSDNGRKNVADALKNKTWATAVNLAKLQVVNGITNTTQTADANIETNVKKTYSLPANVSIAVSGSETYNKQATANDPQKTHSSTTQYLQALYACMNRNRDENGNGTIDLNEIKWYLPSSGNYLRMIIGRGTLPTPLMDYKQVDLPTGCSAGFNTLYHYISSDAKIIWVDEGASSSRVDQSADWNPAPWQLRCIRSLGTNLGDDSSHPESAYSAETDKTTGGGMVKVTRYYGTALREPTAGALPLHKSDAQENKIALYGFEIAPIGNDFDGTYTNEAGFSFTVTENGVTGTKNLGDCGDGGDKYYQEVSDAISAATMCSSLNETSGRRGWRAPNQTEVIIMMRLGVFGDHKPIMLSCTQEHWANYGTPGSSNLPMSWNYRFVSVNPSIGNAVAPHNSEIRHVRCVRDLTMDEAKLTYSELTANN